MTTSLGDGSHLLGPGLRRDVDDGVLRDPLDVDIIDLPSPNFFVSIADVHVLAVITEELSHGFDGLFLQMTVL